MLVDFDIEVLCFKTLFDYHKKVHSSFLKPASLKARLLFLYFIET